MIHILQSELQNQFATLLMQMRDVVARELEQDSARWREFLTNGAFGNDLRVQNPDLENSEAHGASGCFEEADADSNQLWPQHPHQPQLLRPPEPGQLTEMDKEKVPGVAKLLKKGSTRMDWMDLDRKIVCQSKTADIRHSLLHSIAELDTQTRDPLNHKLRKSVTAIFTTFAPPLHKANTWISEEEPQTRLSQIRLYFQQRVVETTAFESVVIFMICFNTVMIGVNCDWNLTHLNSEEPKYFQIVERIFAVIFALELFLRVFAYGTKFFCGRSEA